MKCMFIERLWPSGDIRIHVEGYEKIRYCLCSKREAIKMYRQKFNLVGKHLDIYDYS